MKICIVSDYHPAFHKTWSGAELIAVTLSDMLLDAGHQPFFLTTSFDVAGSTCRYPVYSVRTPLRRFGPISRNFPVDLAALFGVFHRLRKEKPSVVHINAKHLFLSSIIACRLLRIPVVFTVPDYFMFCPTTFVRRPDGQECVRYHGSACIDCLPVLSGNTFKRVVRMVPRALLKFLLFMRAKEFDFFLKRVTSFVVLSSMSRARLMRRGIPERKVKLIYHYRLGAPAAANSQVRNPSAVFVGWLSEENGTDILMKAFALVVKDVPDAALYLVGTGKDEFLRKIRRYAVDAGISGNVVFTGKLDNPEALSVVARSDVTVVPHQWAKEFGPIIVLEALALGKPVITSRIGATEEFIDNGQSGFLVSDHNDPGAFADKIGQCFRDPEKAKAMGRCGKDKVRFLFDGSAVREMIALYTDITGSDARRRCGI